MKEVAMPDLYVIDHDRLRIRKSRVYGTDDHATWLVETGLKDGALVPHEVIYTEGKGKRNAFEQACSEQLSKHKLKIKKDKYREGEENAIDPSEDPYPPPMLAKKYEPKKHKPPFFLQPKLDGNRCLARVKNGKVEMWSRQGNLFQGLEHIEKALLEAAEAYEFEGSKEEVIFDGELFTWELPFKDINGALKTKPKDPDTLTGKAREKALQHAFKRASVQYWIYDMPSIGGDETRRQNIRLGNAPLAGIPEAAEEITADESPIVSVPSIRVDDIETMQRVHSMFLEAGYEGTIIRLPEGEYEYDRRSPNLLKWKEFHDEEYMVVDVVEAERLAGAGILVCQKEDGGRFKATPKCSVEEKCHILANKQDFIGKEVTVEYFETFEDGTPRFPVAKVSL